MTTSLTRSQLDIEMLRQNISGEGDLFTESDPGFDSVRMAWNLAFTHRPTAVVVPVASGAVVETVRFAAATGMSVTIQATGHGPTRPAHGSILVNMARMRGVTIDPESSTAWVEGGAKWQDVLDQSVEYGLAPLLGSTPDVGVVGYTLGGGLGWLARKFGPSADSVNRFEIVTADGELRTASASENPDLFWALRGGGVGNLGIVTGLEIKLYPVAEVYGGNLLYPAEDAAEVMARWREWVPTLPDDFTAGVTLMNFPPIDDVPEPIRGKSFVIVRGAFDGPMEEGERMLSYWREWRAPAIDMFGPLPMARIAEISQDPLDPLPGEVNGAWMHSLSDAAIDAFVAGTFPQDGPPLVLFTEVRHSGGAIARVGQDEAAFGNRDATFLLEMVGLAPTPEVRDAIRATTSAMLAGSADSLTGGLYLNFLEGDDRRNAAVHAVGEEALRRLARIKSEVDPNNVFDHGVDITE